MYVDTVRHFPFQWFDVIQLTSMTNFNIRNGQGSSFAITLIQLKIIKLQMVAKFCWVTAKLWQRIIFRMVFYLNVEQPCL